MTASGGPTSPKLPFTPVQPWRPGHRQRPLFVLHFIFFSRRRPSFAAARRRRFGPRGWGRRGRGGLRRGRWLVGGEPLDPLAVARHPVDRVDARHIGRPRPAVDRVRDTIPGQQPVVAAFADRGRSAPGPPVSRSPPGPPSSLLCRALPGKDIVATQPPQGVGASRVPSRVSGPAVPCLSAAEPGAASTSSTADRSAAMIKQERAGVARQLFPAADYAPSYGRPFAGERVHSWFMRNSLLIGCFIATLALAACGRQQRFRRRSGYLDRPERLDRAGEVPGTANSPPLKVPPGPPPKELVVRDVKKGTGAEIRAAPPLHHELPRSRLRDRESGRRLLARRLLQLVLAHRGTHQGLGSRVRGDAGGRPARIDSPVGHGLRLRRSRLRGRTAERHGLR